MRKLLTIALALMLVLGIPAAAFAADDPSNWAKAEVDKAIGLDLVPEGLQADYQSAITREGFCVLIMSLGNYFDSVVAGEDSVTSAPFNDTENESVTAAFKLGIVNGKAEGIFDPAGMITRQEAAAMLTRAAKAYGADIGAGASDFSDYGAVAAWAKSSVDFVAANGVMSGVGDNIFSPVGAYTREQSILTVLRLYNVIEGETGKPVISEQPASAAVAVNDSVTLSVSAKGGGNGDLTYQWFKTKDPVNRVSDDIQIIGNEGTFIPPTSTDGAKIDGATESAYAPPTNIPGVESYYVEVSNGEAKTASAAATVAVKPSKSNGFSDPVKILFVCGGNTGRSPMAKAITEEVFKERGISAIIDSAGSDIIEGDTAEENAIALMAERGLDLTGHVAKWWTPQMLQDADLVLVMSESHKNRLNVPTLNIYSDKIFLLREYVGDSGSVPDPFGQPMEAYIETANILTDAAEKLADIISKQ